MCWYEWIVCCIRISPVDTHREQKWWIHTTCAYISSHNLNFHLHANATRISMRSVHQRDRYMKMDWKHVHVHYWTKMCYSGPSRCVHMLKAAGITLHLDPSAIYILVVPPTVSCAMHANHPLIVSEDVTLHIQWMNDTHIATTYDSHMCPVTHNISIRTPCWTFALTLYVRKQG